MSRDAARSSGPSRGIRSLPPEIAHCARLGQQLGRASLGERDLAWHVAAYHVGDLTALVSARLRADAELDSRV